MARVLAISSFVSYGHVGLAAIVPALERLGHEVVSVPTVVLSSHKGYETVAGFDVDPLAFEDILETLAANGWLDAVEGVITGYLPTAGHVAAVARALDRIGEQPESVLYLCDPILGDDPSGLYVDPSVAAAVRDELIPLADILTPNRFELEWLTGLPVPDLVAAKGAASRLAEGAVVAATSIPAGNGCIANLICQEDRARSSATRLLADVPHGTGDLFAALYLGHALNFRDSDEALALASAGVETVILGSLHCEELRLGGLLPAAVAAPPHALEDV